jgi:hypothetical protein
MKIFAIVTDRPEEAAQDCSWLVGEKNNVAAGQEYEALKQDVAAADTAQSITLCSYTLPDTAKHDDIIDHLATVAVERSENYEQLRYFHNDHYGAL